MKRIVDELLAEKTFQPFVFVMNSGERYEVHDYSMAVSEEDFVTVFRPRSNRKDILRLNAISSLEILDPDELK